jgi:hypothetical protein
VVFVVIAILVILPSCNHNAADISADLTSSEKEMGCSAVLRRVMFRSDGCCCESLMSRDSLRESMALEAAHEQAISRPLPYDELVQFQCIAQEAGVSADLDRQGHDLARAA